MSPPKNNLTFLHFQRNIQFYQFTRIYHCLVALFMFISLKKGQYTLINMSTSPSCKCARCNHTGKFSCADPDRLMACNKALEQAALKYYTDIVHFPQYMILTEIFHIWGNTPKYYICDGKKWLQYPFCQTSKCKQLIIIISSSKFEWF